MESSSNKGSDLHHSLDRACLALNEALSGIFAFQRRFFPLDPSDSGDDLKPIQEALEQTIREIQKIEVPGNISEPYNIINKSVHLSHDITGRILTALTMDHESSIPRLSEAYRLISQIQEDLYPVRFLSPHLNRLFLEVNAEIVDIPEDTPQKGPRVGLHHYNNASDAYARGAFSLYVPEHYDEKTEWPLIVALHGGSGHGRAFIWTWLREARSRGFILLAPSSLDRTWNILEPEEDGEALFYVLDFVDKHYNIDLDRILLTGFSDGGTFALMCALQEQVPFTAFAPVSCVLPPFDIGFAKGKRIYWVHGELDWMFPLNIIKKNIESLEEIGADVTLRLLDDLSHTYPREENDGILAWFDPGMSLQKT